MRIWGKSRSADGIEQYSKRSSLNVLDFLVRIEKFANKTFLCFHCAAKSILQKQCAIFWEYLGLQMR